MNDIQIILDWFTFSCSFKDFKECIIFLGLSDYESYFKPCPGRWFYKFGITYNNEITIYMGNNDDIHSACVNISGRGCRFIESFSTVHLDELLFNVYNSPGFQVTRCDIALDIIDDVFKIQNLIDDTRKGNYRCRSKFYNIMESMNDGVPGYSIYFGKKDSNIFINIYDKRSERGLSSDDCPAWTRIEIRLRHENARGFLKSYVKHDKDLSLLYFGILNNYLCFLKPSKTDSNKSRWKVAPYWQRLVQSKEIIKVFDKPGVEYDYSKFEHYLFTQVGSSIVTYLKIHSLDELKQELELRDIKLNSKQQFLIDNYQEGEYFKLL